MKRSLSTLTLFTTLFLSSSTYAQSVSDNPCAFSAEELSSALGDTFAGGKDEPGLMGKACSYKGKNTTLWVQLTPVSGMTVEQIRKMTHPGGAKWEPVAGDTDKAMIDIQAPDVPPFPAISYERNGYLSEVFLSGMLGDGASDRRQDVAAANQKLLKLKRIP